MVPIHRQFRFIKVDLQSGHVGLDLLRGPFPLDQ